MTPSLRVVTPGLLTTIQDLGRIGYQHLGVPVSGALDPVSLQAANLLVGNAAGAAALEVAYLGPTLAVEADDVRVAAVGADAVLEILPDAAASDARRVDGMRSLRLHRGESLRVGALKGGAVLYIAVEGGFDIAPVLGSVSTDIRGAIGGWRGRALVAGDQLPLSIGRAGARDEVRLDGLDLRPRARIRAVPGPQHDLFPAGEVEAFFAGEYMVGPSADRMAMRLTGRAIRHSKGFDIPSDGIAPGAIQVPGNGQPVVLLADRQTTGGYAKIATVISADLPALSRLPVGARVGFEAVTVEEAEAARREHLSVLATLKDKIVPVDVPAIDMAPRLQACNLISGFVDAAV
jgi:biotin-dependent carboxylase-like uncharacterized protein